MRRSFNEVESLMRKAGVGAGLPLGHAEDIARAGAWLCRFGCDGVACIASLFGAMEHAKEEAAIAGDASPMSQLLAAPIVVDRVLVDGAGGMDVACPEAALLLCGLAGSASSDHGAVLRLKGGRHELLIDQGCPCSDAPSRWTAGEIQITRLEGRPDEKGLQPGLRGIIVDADSWRFIETLAARTYVPASEASRLLGAGAGLTDND